MQSSFFGISCVSQTANLLHFWPLLHPHFDLSCLPQSDYNLTIPTFDIDPDLNFLLHIWSWLKPRLPLIDMRFVLFTFVIARSTCLSPRLILTYSNHFRHVFALLQRCRKAPHVAHTLKKNAAPAVFSNTPSISALSINWKWPCKIFHWSFTCLGMNAVLFLYSVLFAQKLSGKGNPLLWWGSCTYPKGKYLHNIQDARTVTVAQTLHSHRLYGLLWCLGAYLQVSMQPLTLATFLLEP